MFKIRIEQVDLINSLRKIKNTTGKGKDAAKIYDKYIFLEGYAEMNTKDRYLRLVTTNYTDTSDIMIPCIEATDGASSCIVEFDKFYGLVSTIPQDKIITLEADGINLKMNYEGRKKPIVLPGNSSENYPLPIINNEDALRTTFTFSAIKHGVELISNIIHNTDNQLYNCIKIKSTKKLIVLTALDATYRRTVMYASNEKGTEEAEFFLEGSRLKGILNSFDAAKKVTVCVTENNITFEQNDLNIQMRLVNGTFPDCQSYFSKQYKTEIVANKNDLLNSLRRLDILTDDTLKTKACVFDIQKEHMNISVNNAMQNENVSIELTGEPVKDIAFNIDSLMTALQTIQTDEVMIRIKDKKSCVLEPTGQEGYIFRCLILATVLRS